MDADEFVAAVRKGNDKLRLDNLVLTTPESELTGKGLLWIEGEKLHIDMTLDSGVEAPQKFGTGVVGQSQFWKLRGVIDGSLPFHCNYGPGPNININSARGTTLSSTVNPIELEPTGFDALTLAERKAWFKQQKEQAGLSADPELKEEQTNSGGKEDKTFEFHAWFPRYELRFTNAGSKVVRTNDYLGEYSSHSSADTLVGETPAYTFGIIQEDDDDLHLVMRSKDGVDATGDDGDRAKFHALLAALSFVHGKNAWPYRVQYWREGAKRCDTVTAIRDLPSTPHTPFSGMGHGVDPARFIGNMAYALETRTEFAEKITHILFLFRQAGDKGVQHEVGTLAICTIFESLLKLLFEQCDLEQAALEQDEVVRYEAGKAKLLEQLEGWPAAEKDVAYQRLKGRIKTAEPLTLREKFRALCAHLGLAWEGDMEAVFKAWNKARNPLAHGKFGGEDEGDFKNLALAESRIAGGFNTLVLKYFGYTGYYNASAFEPGFQQM